MVESELFGHEKGAYTGAASRHLGRFERAHRGTLLLDEVGELPLAAQVKLLRVLQEGTIERVGGERAIPVDVRVIAATHRPLERMVAKRAFRADLFYRLNVFPLELPPLRERVEDVPTLVQHELERLCARQGRRVPTVTGDVMADLVARRWPGNVRELGNVLERALILSPGDTLELEPVAEPLGRERGVVSGRPRTLDQMVKQAIEAALTACEGRVYGRRGAAARLGLRPSTLQGKMRKLGIARSPFARHDRAEER